MDGPFFFSSQPAGSVIKEGVISKTERALKAIPVTKEATGVRSARAGQTRVSEKCLFGQARAPRAGRMCSEPSRLLRLFSCDVVIFAKCQSVEISARTSFCRVRDRPLGSCDVMHGSEALGLA
ncbi:hypothetical protein EVAR_4113_1 [Eumeta japonica]|uniref:Uncharacterized protein n=1 Tax=Eumeta variegata TaxID=151549 RepID=A0A4C1T506_EUMVA|nr:hypothetical protein EVAR_4113_1 [Eumeta japonica]